MSGLKRKLDKLRRNPRQFAYDLVASQARGGRGPASWLLGKMVAISTDSLVTLASEQSTIGPLQRQLSERVARYGAAEMARAATRAFERLASDGGGLACAENFFIAVTLALVEHDRSIAIELGDSLADAVGREAISSLVISLRDAEAYDDALHFITWLDVDDAYSRLESELFLRKLESDYGDSMTTALAIGEDAVRELADEIIGTEAPLPAFHFLYGRVFARYIEDRSFAELVTTYGEHLLELADRSWTAAQVADTHLYRGSISDGIRILQAHGELGDEVIANKLAMLADFERVRARGFDHHLEVPEEPFTALPGVVLFILHHSAPFHSNGYATRAHGLLTAINQRSWDVAAVTRTGYPRDLRKFASAEVEPLSRVDGVDYFRLFGSPINGTPLHSYLSEYADSLLAMTVRREPEIIHAHSNGLNGLVANLVARALDIPSIYEVRGLWEVTRASRQPEFDGSEYFDMLRRMEIAAAKEADHVICITEALAAEVARWGVDPDTITVVPNGVDTERFVPRDRDRALEEELSLEGKRVIGYIGSLVDYEGLDDLLSAVRVVIGDGDERRTDIAVLIVGDGASTEGLKRQVEELGLQDVVTFTGRVPHEEVERYYSLVDIAPFPRKSLPVTEMVSPLKPFEAMAMNKVVVGSDVAAIAEIISEGVNGFLFAKDDPDALAAALERALESLDGGERVGAREWVIEHRSWDRMAERLDGVYNRLSRLPRRSRVVDLKKLELGDEIAAIMEQYKERLGGADSHLLRRDDYARFSLVFDRVIATTGASLLDVGVGVGVFLNTLARAGRFARLRGVDIEKNPAFVASGAFEVDYTSVESLPYTDGEFDVVTCQEVIEHLDDDIFETGIAELRRVCGGTLVVTVPFRERVLAEDHKRRFDFDDLERLFPTADIEIMRKGNSQLGRPTYWALIEERQG